jgi:hypothetical protein
MKALKDYRYPLSIALLVAVLALVAVLLQRPQLSFGSVASGDAYQATSTKDHLGNTIADLQRLKNGSGILGHVVITGANTGTFCLHDATTTNATLRTKTATSTIACFPASVAAGTYIFDLTFNDGLILDYGVLGGTSLMATATVTWK